MPCSVCPGIITFLSIAVSYSNSVAEVYRETAAHLILSNNNMDILSSFPKVDDTIHGLSSWVPRFDHLVSALNGGHWPLIDIGERCN